MVMLALLSGCQAKKGALIIAGPPPANAVAIDAYTWDFGRARQGEILKHDFLLKNDSDKVLNIKSIDTSCGCTVSKTKKSALLPQEATLIEVNFDSKGYLGPVQQVVYVNTDSLDMPVIRYIIKAEVIK